MFRISWLCEGHQTSEISNSNLQKSESWYFPDKAYSAFSETGRNISILNSSVKEYVCLTHMSYCCSRLYDDIYGYTYVRWSSNEI